MTKFVQKVRDILQGLKNCCCEILAKFDDTSPNFNFLYLFGIYIYGQIITRSIYICNLFVLNDVPPNEAN